MLSSDRSKNVVIAAALLGAVGLIAVRRLPRMLLERATYSDGSSVLSDLGALRHAVWDAPERLPATVNSSAREGRPALSPDGRWLVYALGEPGLSCDLWIAELDAGEPREARPLTALNTPADELAPAFGEGVLYFASDRAGGAGGYDLWAAPFEDGVAGEAVPLSGGIDTQADELDPAFVRDASGERLLAFASDRARGGRDDLDLYLAHLDLPGVDGADAVALERLEAACSEGQDREPAFALDGRALFLASDRDAPGRFALYRTLRDPGGWLPAREVEGLGAGDPRGPAPSADGFTLWFDADAPAAEGVGPVDRDLYRARSIEVLRRPAPALGWMDLLLAGLLLATALLAWLAKRWHELDVLYKCFLASVILHLILMALLRGVRPEGEPLPQRDGEGPTFRVHVLPDSSLAARTRERGGELETTRPQASTAQGPTRLEARPTHLRPTSAPSVEVARAEAAPASAPGRTQVRLERETAASDEATVALQAPAERFERLDAAAPALELRAVAAPAERATQPDVEPEALQATRLAAEGARRSTEPGEAVVQAPRAALADRPAFSPSGAAPVVDPGREDASVALAAPQERFERPDAGAAPQVDLPRAERFAHQPAEEADDAPAPWSGAGELLAEGPERPSAPPAASPSIRRASEPAPPAAGPAPDVERALDAGAAREDVALAVPRERFEPTRPAAAPPAAPSLPAASSFAPPRAATPEPSGPARWSAPVAAAAPREPDRPPPVEALAARPRDDVRGLPEPPRRLDDTPYRTRFGAEKAVALAEHGGDATTEEAVARGLAYLASIQNGDGSWGDPRRRHEKYRQVAVGKSALAMLAFLGAGHTPGEGRYADNVRRAVAFLLSVQDERTGHFGDSSAYSHGIATYALAECFALTRDASLRAPLERAVRQILRNQVGRGDERLVGGWSYYYPDGSIFDRWPRVSISAWQVMALESARLGGLEVPDEAFEAARSFLVRSWDPRLGAFRYSQDPSRLRSGYPTLPGSTPAALFALGLLGVDVGADALAPARRFTLERAPAGFRWSGDQAFVERAQGNVYFWYYGSLALFRVGGDAWERWNAALKQTLLPSQEGDGSWRPLDVYARYAGDDEHDRSYTTAMCVLSLEVYYRYFTPLLKVR